MNRTLALLLLGAGLLTAASPVSRLKVAVVQMSISGSLESNKARIVDWTAQAAARGARVVVFPEGALSAPPNAREDHVQGAVDEIRQAARTHDVYILFGGWSWSARHNQHTNWMKVVAPSGRELLHYDKLWDVHDAPTPGLFSLDGVPASAILCADRWLRAVEDLPVQRGARISFELSNNYDSEWVPELEWYWYVPRAIRNTIWVVFANSGNRTPGRSEPGSGLGPRHGHSAVVAPDGTLAAAVRDDLETLLVAEIDPARATRAEALERGRHPLLGAFWQAGLELVEGRVLPAPAPARKDSPAAGITVAAAQFRETPSAEHNIAAMVESIAEAARRGADLVVFPELSVTGGKLAVVEGAVERLGAAARAGRITVVFGMPMRQGESWKNSAFVLGPDGAVQTRYDQLAARPPFTPGDRAPAMWFAVKGVPAVLTIGREGLWNELAELAAVAGARLHVHIGREAIHGPQALLRHRQIGAALASFSTFTVMANAGGGSAIWDDLSASQETRAVLRGLPRPDTGAVRIFSPFSANLAVEAGSGPALITATRRIPGTNTHHPKRTSNFHPAMAVWYEYGAEILTGRSTR